MKNRILTGWNFIRGIYLLLGLIISIQSVLRQEWAGLLLGLWFTSMSLFGIGCAGGSCRISDKTNSH